MIGSPTNTVHGFYYNSGYQVLEITQKVGAGSVFTSRQFVWGLRYIDAPVLRVRDANGGTSGDGTLEETLYYLNDANFNVTALLDTDGTVVERYAYDPYGLRHVLDADYSADGDNVSDVANDLGFQGLMHDAESGLVYNRARMLHVVLGRFMQWDPLGYVDGMNAYAAYHVMWGGVDPRGTSADALATMEALQFYLDADIRLRQISQRHMKVLKKCFCDLLRITMIKQATKLEINKIKDTVVNGKGIMAQLEEWANQTSRDLELAKKGAKQTGTKASKQLADKLGELKDAVDIVGDTLKLRRTATSGQLGDGMVATATTAKYLNAKNPIPGVKQMLQFYIEAGEAIGGKLNMIQRDLGKRNLIYLQNYEDPNDGFYPEEADAPLGINWARSVFGYYGYYEDAGRRHKCWTAKHKAKF